ncbi:MAG TPA: methyltransferase domain-containing protein, partial [Candidatus Tectomicrobia bacterium]
NPDLDEYVVHNVNTAPQLPFEADTFDAVVLTVSIQYITQPVPVFQEVWRILRPGGPFIVIFSNRMFPTKAVAVWRTLDDRKHVDLVASYFHYAGNFVEIAAHNWSPSAYTDPVYVVLARKPAA